MVLLDLSAAFYTSITRSFLRDDDFVMWSPSGLCFRTGVIFSLYFYISLYIVVIRTHGINAMMIAHDSQLYVIMRQSNRGTGLQGLTLCIQDIMSWVSL